MIIIKEITWNNWFSYGSDNKLSLDDGKVTQVTGKNGSGKSSIPVIIGEVLYGKNALGKTKQKLFNRYLEKTTLTAIIKFEKDNDEYEIIFSRKTALKLTLFKNGEDISSHNTTNTYKTLESILGYDFKTFWGLIYQSSKEGLDFLTATDTNRKKFLINLFNLDQYLDIHEFFKNLSNKINQDLSVLRGQVSTIESWIGKHRKEDLIKRELEFVPILYTKDIDKLTNLKVQLAGINDENRKINNNEELKNILEKLDTSILNETINIPDTKEQLLQSKKNIENEESIQKSDISRYKKEKKHIESLGDVCPTCEQEVSTEFKEFYIKKLDDRIENAQGIIDINKPTYESGLKKIEEISKLQQRKFEQDRVSQELQDLLVKIDKTLPIEVTLESDIKTEIDKLSSKVTEIQDQITDANKRNLIIEAHNSKVKVIKQQLIEYKEQIDELLEEVTDKDNVYNRINIIKKAFSTNGLISYKIENLSKELEHQINIYLSELSKGRFQLSFTIVGEKLNIEIIDDSISISIEELSAGELARVNTATLLAIRKLMAALSSNKINILFLDEILGVLDEEGKEVLIDILNAETELNTFLVSHEFTHPLIPQVNIIKENKISRIENDK